MCVLLRTGTHMQEYKEHLKLFTKLAPSDANLHTFLGELEAGLDSPAGLMNEQAVHTDVVPTKTLGAGAGAKGKKDPGAKKAAVKQTATGAGTTPVKDVDNWLDA
jgi:hypothetical protein